MKLDNDTYLFFQLNQIGGKRDEIQLNQIGGKRDDA